MSVEFVLMDEHFVTTMEAGIIEPLQKFQTSLNNMLADAKNGLFKASEEYEASLNEYASTPSSSCLRRDETAKALYLAKEKLCLASVHYATLLNEIPAIREAFVMDKISNLLSSLSAWATQTQINIEASVPLVKNAIECIEECETLSGLNSVHGNLDLKSWKSSSSGKDPLSLPSNWRKVVLIVRSNGILYQFNAQDKTVIENIKLRDVYRNQIQMIDESALKKKNCFYLRTKQRVCFFMAESLSERNEWVAILKSFAQPEVLGFSDEMDGERRAKTSVKNRTSAPYWREDFHFSDMPVLNHGVDITLMNHNKLQKDAYIGKITIPLSTIKRGEYYEGWYPIVHESKASHYPPDHVGDIRLRLRYDEVVVLPSANYEELVGILLDVESKVVFDLVGISKNLEWFSENMMRIYEGRNYALEWLTYLAYHEVNSTDDSNILFRGNSILTKAIDSYMKMIGLQYVDEAIGSIVRSICENKIVCEVDMTKLEKNQDIRGQWRILLTYTKMLWQAIEKSKAKCPAEFRVFFANLRKIITDKFASELDKSLVRYTCVRRAILMTWQRIPIPASLLPGSPIPEIVQSEHPDGKTRRTLTLLAKSLQCLANLADFGSKEPYMIHMNEFIRHNATSLMEFIDYVSVKPISLTPLPRILPSYQNSESFFLPPQIPNLVDIDKELSNFSNFISCHREDIQQLLSEKTNLIQNSGMATNGISIPDNLDCRAETPCSSDISQPSRSIGED
ncbi:Rho GTPase activation protein [Basidiobolus meristosporus CBS 931.73]|uniref:Rho GTPase activation protein n=1 Tax=Basidiobolus meristosporus CBS 931.73 TaxID=1314790 RepID=A0A1Y1YJD6_9FUNG|nr:Rho GTPase activation protein [Basidiobolus meristosporus CBS 931.73]|eukprot:ORX97973.1 Rho GTPase activation protein [Basidiobolus meristosporus CBS 931.73]